LTSTENSANVGAGGAGVVGGNRGAGEGRGLFLDGPATVSLAAGLITNNHVIGGAIGSGTTSNGTTGEGQGRGVLLTDTGSTSTGSLIHEQCHDLDYVEGSAGGGRVSR
jgi:hypothetical protein